MPYEIYTWVNLEPAKYEQIFVWKLFIWTYEQLGKPTVSNLATTYVSQRTTSMPPAIHRKKGGQWISIKYLALLPNSNLVLSTKILHASKIKTITYIIVNQTLEFLEVGVQMSLCIVLPDGLFHNRASHTSCNIPNPVHKEKWWGTLHTERMKVTFQLGLRGPQIECWVIIFSSWRWANLHGYRWYIIPSCNCWSVIIAASLFRNPHSMSRKN